MLEEKQRKLELGDGKVSLLAGCDISLYSEFKKRNLPSVWKAKDDKDDSTRSMLDSNIIREICVAESNTSM